MNTPCSDYQNDIQTAEIVAELGLLCLVGGSDLRAEGMRMVLTRVVLAECRVPLWKMVQKALKGAQRGD